MKNHTINPLRILLFIPKLGTNVIKETIFFTKFILILSIYSIHALLSLLTCHRFVKPIFRPICRPMSGLIFKTIALIDRPLPQEIASVDLVELAYEELKVKKTRTIITIGGMSLGFGLIVFLLSIGFGLERLVISRVAKLNEMRQTDVLVGQATSLYIDDALVTEIEQRQGVETVLPQISLVAKIDYNNSAADAVVYGVTTRYLEESAIRPIEGAIFTDEEYAGLSLPDNEQAQATTSGEVAGATIELLSEVSPGRELNKVRYSIYPLTWVPVYANPARNAKILGYTNRQPGEHEAIEVWGLSYPLNPNSLQGLDPEGEKYSSWIRDSFPIWDKKPCESTNFECVDGNYLIVKADGKQQLVTGFIMEDQVSLERYSIITDPTAKPNFGARIQPVSFQLDSNSQVPVYLMPSMEAAIDKETTQTYNNSTISGTLVFGLSYYDEQGYGAVTADSSGKKLGYWIETTVPIWYQIDCDGNCETEYLPKLDSNKEQVMSTVYLRAIDVASIAPPPPQIKPRRAYNQTIGQVLGQSTISDELMEQVLGEISESSNSAESSLTDDDESWPSTDTLYSAESATDSASTEFDLESLENDLEWSSIASIAGIIQPKEVEILPAPEKLKKVAVVNTSFLTMLGLPIEQAVGTQFGANFVFDGKLFGDNNYRAESAPVEYTIVAVLPDSKTPAFYIPLSDLQNFAVSRYSQLKIMVEQQDQLPQLRQDVEALGFKTSSVVDTVEQINSLFRTLRLALTVVGLVALGVAALGMFNTLTVSLLEKTRQVGLMKAMGMKSNEVKRLFLAESVIMGVAGGLFGLSFAFLGGKLLSAFLSSLSIAQGLGVIDVAHIPFSLFALVFLCSFAMGIATGLYPSYRATKISALNALRYE